VTQSTPVLKYSCLFIVSLLLTFCASAQQIDVSKYKEHYKLAIKKTAQPIKIDGELNETDWQQAQAANDFWLKFPTDDTKAKHKTEARVLYDEKFLYIGFSVIDSMPLIGQSLKRDSRIRENDGVGVMLDPFGQKTSGF